MQLKTVSKGFALWVLAVPQLTCHPHTHVANEDDGCCTYDGTQHAYQLVGVGLGSQWPKRVVLCGPAAYMDTMTVSA